ncbi:MAG: hypothetical protein AAGH65_01950 [Pseudomonadota bacterium]
MKLVRLSSSLFVIATLFLLAFHATVFAGPGVWTSTGPNGGQVNGLAASPFNNNEFYATSRGGVFKTVDGGVTWVDSSAGINRQITNIVHSQTSANRLMVTGSTRIFYTDNGAASWQDRTPAIPLPANNFYSLLEVSPTQPGVYYLYRSDGVILRTGDSGLNWTESPVIPEPAGFSFTAMAADPVTPDRLLFTTSNFSTNDFSLWVADLAAPMPGSVWSEIPCPPASDCPWEFVPIEDVVFGSAGRVWAVNFDTAFRSDDGGVTWTTPVTSDVSRGSGLAVNPSNNAEVYVVADVGLRYSLDDGVNWTYVTGGFVGNDLLQPTRATEIVFNPFNTSLQLVGSQSNGVYRRTGLPPADSFTVGVDGFNAQNIRAVTTTLGNRVHAAVGDAFVATFASFRSTDNGTTWNQANSLLEADHFRSLVVDPNNIDVVYAGGVFRPKDDGTDTGTFTLGNGGIYKSTNEGLTWATIDNGIPLSGPPFDISLFGTVRDIEVDQFGPVAGGESQILYAAGSGRFADDGMGGFNQLAGRIYKSMDAGANWTVSDTGIGGAETGVFGGPLFASAVQIIQDTTDTTGNTLYAATFIGGRDATDVPLTIDNGVFVSTNAGGTWTNITNGLPRIGGNPAAAAIDVLSLAFDPTDATGQTLYASTNDLANSVIGSVYKTTDGGANWIFSGVGLDNRDVRDLIVDPVTGNVYAAVADPQGNGDGGVFLSEDGGASWGSVSTGFPGAAVATKLALDNTGTNLLIQAGTTRGIQTFEVIPDEDVDGAPTPLEDGAPNSGDGNTDGMDDSMQQNVASPLINNIFRGTASYITASLTPVSGNCTALQDSFGLDLLSGVPAERALEAPFNGLHLRIPDCEQAEVTLIYHEAEFDDPSYVVRGYGLAFPDEDAAVWHTLPATLDNGIEWTVTLTDGAPGDATPDDGIIVFQGAAKRLVEDFFSDSMEAE